MLIEPDRRLIKSSLASPRGGAIGSGVAIMGSVGGVGGAEDVSSVTTMALQSPRGRNGTTVTDGAFNANDQQ